MSSESHERVGWPEVAENLIDFLMLDREWVVLAEDGLDWYASELRSSVDVVDSGEYGDGDNWIKLRSSVDVFATSEAHGVEMAVTHNRHFALGAFIFRDGRLSIQSTFVFNPLNRGLIRHFAIQVLAQATIAHLMRGTVEVSDEIAFVDEPHPEFGVRTEPDAILEVYTPSVVEIPGRANVESAIDVVRTGELRDYLLHDFAPGFSDVDVDFYQTESFAFGVGTLDGTPEFDRFGPGIMTNVMSMRRRLPLDAAECNDFNLVFGELEMVSQFGPLRAAPDGVAAEAATASLFAQLPYASVAHLVGNTQGMKVQMINFLTHAVGPIIQLERQFSELDETNPGPA